MKIAFIGKLPAANVFPPECIRPNHRVNHHPAPWIAALLPELATRSDHELRVFLPDRSILKHRVIEKDGVTYEGIPLRFTQRWEPQTGYLARSLAIQKYVRAFQPDLVHAFGLETGNATIALRTKFPVSCFIQGIVEKLSPWIGHSGYARRYFLRREESKAVKKIRWFVAENEFARQWALSRNPEAQVQIIPHPLRPDFLTAGTSQGGTRIVSVGGLDARKGMDTIIKALAMMEHKQATLRIIGGGPDMGMLRQLVHDLGLDGRVELPGPMPSEMVIEELKQAGAFVIASRMDTSPNALTEAHAMGLPVVATRVGGIPEMISPGIDGFLVDRDDAMEMAKKLDWLVCHPEESLQMGLAGRDKVRSLNDARTNAELHADYFTRISHELGSKSR